MPVIVQRTSYSSTTIFDIAVSQDNQQDGIISTETNDEFSAFRQPLQYFDNLRSDEQFYTPESLTTSDCKIEGE